MIGSRDPKPATVTAARALRQARHAGFQPRGAFPDRRAGSFPGHGARPVEGIG
jgi:hypothetical protein